MLFQKVKSNQLIFKALSKECSGFGTETFSQRVSVQSENFFTNRNFQFCQSEFKWSYSGYLQIGHFTLLQLVLIH